MAIFTGTGGDDSINGTSGNDDFHLEQGGQDHAYGGAGLDVFYMGATFDTNDTIDGGSNNDFIVLDGDYSAGVAFNSTTMINIEGIEVTAGHSYDFTGMTSANIGSTFKIDGSALGEFDSLHFDASGVSGRGITMLGGAGADSLLGGDAGDSILGGAGSDYLRGNEGNDTITGGDGADTLGGGRGNDYFTFGSGLNSINGGEGSDTIVASSSMDTHDVIDGGSGFDYLYLGGGTYNLSGDNVTGVEFIHFSGAADVKAQTTLISGGQTLYVSIDNGGALDFNGKKEVDSRYNITGADQNDHIVGGHQGDSILGGDGDDLLTGGAGNDTLVAGGGTDTLLGGAGNDVLSADSGAVTINAGDGDDVINAFSHVDGSSILAKDGDDTINLNFSDQTVTGGGGADAINAAEGFTYQYNYLKASDSTLDAMDTLSHLSASDVINLSKIDADTTTSGNQAFHIVSDFSGHAGELVLVYDHLRDLTTIEGDVNGDGVADLAIVTSGDQTGYDNFVL